MSRKLASVASAEEVFGFKLTRASLYGLLAVSRRYQFPVVLEILINTYLGLNPVYTNGPSALPLPVYDPNAENPEMAANTYATQPLPDGFVPPVPLVVKVVELTPLMLSPSGPDAAVLFKNKVSVTPEVA